VSFTAAATSAGELCPRHRQPERPAAGTRTGGWDDRQRPGCAPAVAGLRRGSSGRLPPAVELPPSTIAARSATVSLGQDAWTGRRLGRTADWARSPKS